MESNSIHDYSAVVSATGFLRPRASRSMVTFHEHLVTSRRTLALLGAGLSVASGLATYRGAGGVWCTHDVTVLATPAGFASDPALGWQFHLERLREVQNASPNAAHFALARFCGNSPDFLTLTMNVDDLSEKAGHPEETLWHLHGKLQDIKCTECDLYLSGEEAAKAIAQLLQRDPTVPLKLQDVPRCTRGGCRSGLLRPGIVWFTESLPRPLLSSVAKWIGEPREPSKAIDTMLVIGTSALVYPATAYIEAARRNGARVAVVNIEKEDPSLLALEEQDWYFEGDAADLVPKMLEEAINMREG